MAYMCTFSGDVVLVVVHGAGGDCAGGRAVRLHRHLPLPHEQRGRQPAHAGRAPHTGRRGN